jgi:murein DD-endopeptidase MepM/ murein hydrolase activator NlpD
VNSRAGQGGFSIDFSSVVILNSLMAPSFEFAQFEFSPVIDLPAHYDVFDFSCGYDADRVRNAEFGIGRYNEKRPNMYVTPLFTESSEPRDIHIGIDIAAPVGTGVKAFFDGIIFLVGINSAAGDYGGTLITEHRIGDRMIWALHGHLSHASTRHLQVGEVFKRGDVLGWVGERHENGGWNPHLHFQLSWQKPEKCDMPGTVTDSARDEALLVYPDPRLVLGPLYK